MFRVALAALAAAVARAGHNDMFSCRGKGNCDVTEFSEANWAAKLGEADDESSEGSRPRLISFDTERSS